MDRYVAPAAKQNEDAVEKMEDGNMNVNAPQLNKNKNLQM